jgi:dethiobiotin synthase
VTAGEGGDPVVVVVAGTGTEVGKTWLAVRLAEELRAAGRSVEARKPAQSFESGGGLTDADLLGAATGQAPTDVCPGHRWYETPMAPPMAAEVLGRPSFTVGDLVREVRAGWAADVVLVESAGGVRSPLADDGDTVDLATALPADAVVLVGDAGLGTINAVQLATAALGPAPVIVFLNRFDATSDLHRRNRAWLVDRGGHRVTTDPIDLGEAVIDLLRAKVEP